MKFKRERAQEFFPEAMPLFDKHWREIAHYQDIILNVDLETYYSIEDKNMLRCFTVRDDEGSLIGYAIYFLKHNLHYKDSFQAVQDVLFIHPEKRGFGSKLISWCDDELRKEGVQVVYHHVKQAHNFGPLLEKKGYELVDLIYARRLDR